MATIKWITGFTPPLCHARKCRQAVFYIATQYPTQLPAQYQLFIVIWYRRNPCNSNSLLSKQNPPPTSSPPASLFSTQPSCQPSHPIPTQDHPQSDHQVTHQIHHQLHNPFERPNTDRNLRNHGYESIWPINQNPNAPRRSALCYRTELRKHLVASRM